MVTRCPHCGASLQSRTARFCEFCGTELPRKAPAQPARFGDLPARFAELESHPSLGELQRHEPSAASHQAANLFGVLFALVFMGVAVVMFAAFQASAPAPFSFFPLIFLAAGGFLLVKTLTRTSRLASAELTRVPALVVDERIQVSGGSGDSSSHTTYYVSLETADGERVEYESRGRLNGAITSGDMGLAYLKGEILLDFKRLPV